MQSTYSLVMKDMNSERHSCIVSLASFAILALFGSTFFMMRLMLAMGRNRSCSLQPARHPPAACKRHSALCRKNHHGDGIWNVTGHCIMTARPASAPDRSLPLVARTPLVATHTGLQRVQQDYNSMKPGLALCRRGTNPSTGVCRKRGLVRILVTYIDTIAGRRASNGAQRAKAARNCTASLMAGSPFRIRNGTDNLLYDFVLTNVERLLAL